MYKSRENLLAVMVTVFLFLILIFTPIFSSKLALIPIVSKTSATPEGNNTSFDDNSSGEEGDNVQDPNFEESEISPTSENEFPIANAGNDMTVSPGDLVTLDGISSNDPEGNSLSYSWIQTDGPSISLSGSDTAYPTFTSPSVTENTLLRFELTVNDGTADSSPDRVDVAVVSSQSSSTAAADEVVGEQTITEELLNGDTFPVEITSLELIGLNETSGEAIQQPTFPGSDNETILLCMDINPEACTPTLNPLITSTNETLEGNIVPAELLNETLEDFMLPADLMNQTSLNGTNPLTTKDFVTKYCDTEIGGCGGTGGNHDHGLKSPSGKPIDPHKTTGSYQGQRGPSGMFGKGGIHEGKVPMNPNQPSGAKPCVHLGKDFYYDKVTDSCKPKPVNWDKLFDYTTGQCLPNSHLRDPNKPHSNTNICLPDTGSGPVPGPSPGPTTPTNLPTLRAFVVGFLNVKTNIINDNGGRLQNSALDVEIDTNMKHAPHEFQGSASGTSVKLILDNSNNDTAYEVVATPSSSADDATVAKYTLKYSPGCSGNIDSGSTIECIIIADDKSQSTSTGAGGGGSNPSKSGSGGGSGGGGSKSASASTKPPMKQPVSGTTTTTSGTSSSAALSNSSKNLLLNVETKRFDKLQFTQNGVMSIAKVSPFHVIDGIVLNNLTDNNNPESIRLVGAQILPKQGSVNASIIPFVKISDPRTGKPLYKADLNPVINGTNPFTGKLDTVTQITDLLLLKTDTTARGNNTTSTNPGATLNQKNALIARIMFG